MLDEFEDVAVHAISNAPLERFRACVTQVTGDRFWETVDPDGTRYYHTFDNRLYVASIEDFSGSFAFLDDGGMPLSRLPIHITFTPNGTPPGLEERRRLCLGLAIRVASVVFEGLRCDCLVATGMSRRIKTFRLPESDWMGDD